MKYKRSKSDYRFLGPNNIGPGPLSTLSHSSIKDFYYNVLRTLFEALIQRTDGLRCSHLWHTNRNVSQLMRFRYCEEGSDEPLQM